MSVATNLHVVLSLITYSNSRQIHAFRLSSTKKFVLLIMYYTQSIA